MAVKVPIGANHENESEFARHRACPIIVSGEQGKDARACSGSACYHLSCIAQKRDDSTTPDVSQERV